MKCTYQEELILGLRSSINRRLKRLGLNRRQLARLAKLQRSELFDFLTMPVGQVKSSRRFCQKLLFLGRRDTGFWDPLSRRLIMALRDFDDVYT